MLRSIDPTEQALVKHIQCKEVEDRPELPVVLGGDSLGALVRDAPLFAVQDQLDHTDLVGEGTTSGLWRFRISRITPRFLSLKSGSGEVFQVRIDWWETSTSWRIARHHSSLMDGTGPR